MAKRKVVVVIVEGPSDMAALGKGLQSFFDPQKTQFKIVHGDITTKETISSSNIKQAIVDLLKQDMMSYGYHFSDIARIIQIADTDGAFVDDALVVEDQSLLRIKYSDTCIQTNNKHRTCLRNQQKKTVLRMLSKTDSLTYKKIKVPYQIFYMSANLDHVLFNYPNSTDEEKEENSHRFAEDYIDLVKFKEFFMAGNFAVKQPYRESWIFLENGTNSLVRYSNLDCLFSDAQSGTPEGAELESHD